MSATLRFSARGGGLLVIDLQSRLLSKIFGKAAVVANTARLCAAARALGLPVWATEQSPDKLGPTVDSIAQHLPERRPKQEFSACEVVRVREELLGGSRRHLTLVGIEAHVCVAQTALDLLELGVHVQVPADAVGSRAGLDQEIALRRLERAGVVVTTTEAALMEWIGGAGHPAFATIRDLVKHQVPWPGEVEA